MNNNPNETVTETIKVAWYENNRHFIEPILFHLTKKNRFQVEIWESPGKAEKRIEEFRPDLIIFDYRMEPINGVKMFKRLQKRKHAFVPVFFSIWANDDSTRAEIEKAKIESEAIFNKDIEPKSFADAIYKYYTGKKDKK